MRKLKTIWRLIRARQWYVATYDRDDLFRGTSSDQLRLDFIAFIQGSMMKTVDNHFAQEDAVNEAQRIISEHK